MFPSFLKGLLHSIHNRDHQKYFSSTSQLHLFPTFDDRKITFFLMKQKGYAVLQIATNIVTLFWMLSFHEKVKKAEIQASCPPRYKNLSNFGKKNFFKASWNNRPQTFFTAIIGKNLPHWKRTLNTLLHTFVWWRVCSFAK